MTVQLRSLSLLNFRNIMTPKLTFSDGITALVGANAAGKSNVLSAAYLCCSGELPGSKIADVVRIGENEGFVGAKIARNDGVSTVEIGLSAGRKVIRLDGQTVRSVDLAKIAAAVLITPEDANLVHGSPSQRRAYLDSLLGRVSLRYALLIREYQRVVEQRNAALKEPHAFGLDVWTERFIQLGSEIITLRQRAMKRIADIAQTTYQEISSDLKTLGVRLQSDEDPRDLKEQLELSFQEERARGVTVVGPHRDDVILELNGLSVQSFGSRGEARTTALALRVAEYKLLAEKHDEAPVLLIDDFTAELDADRRAFLLNLAASTPQSLVSGTEAPPQFSQLLKIAEGVVRGG